MFTVNMEKNIKTVHIKNNSSCYYSKPYTYLDFNTMEELEEYFKQINKTYRKCEICFKNQYEKGENKNV